jgi:hypothetical protein
MNTILEKRILKQIGISKKEFQKNVTDYQDASSGISGFIYYSETHEFSLKNQSLIVDLLNDVADDLGENVVDMVSNFGIFRNGIDNDEKKDLYNFLGGNKKIKQGSITNVMAWFCVEHLAFELNN